MDNVICKYKGSCDACHFCTHGSDHKPVEPWKEKGKLCTDVHVCEAIAKVTVCVNKPLTK